MIDYGTVKSEGKTLDYLPHTIILMRTEKDTEINKLFDKISKCAFMTIYHKYISSSSHVIKLIRSWENETLTISYSIISGPILGANFSIEDIEKVEESEGFMPCDKVYTVTLKENMVIKFS